MSFSASPTMYLSTRMRFPLLLKYLHMSRSSWGGFCVVRAVMICRYLSIVQNAKSLCNTMAKVYAPTVKQKGRPPTTKTNVTEKQTGSTTQSSGKAFQKLFLQRQGTNALSAEGLQSRFITCRMSEHIPN